MPEAAPGRSPSGGRGRGRGNSNRGRGKGRNNRRGGRGGGGNNNGKGGESTPKKAPVKVKVDPKTKEQKAVANVVDPIEEKVRLMGDQVSHNTLVIIFAFILFIHLYETSPNISCLIPCMPSSIYNDNINRMC